MRWLKDVLGELLEHYPRLYRELELGIGKGYLTVLLNGQNVRFLDGVETALSDGATLAFLPPIGGDSVSPGSLFAGDPTF